MIQFTYFSSPGVAKSYEIIDGVTVKIPAATFKTGHYKTINISSMVEFASDINWVILSNKI